MTADRPTRIIVGVDRSLAGLRALRLAVAQARGRGGEVHAIRVWNGTAPCDPSLPDLYRALRNNAADTIRLAFDDAMGGVPDDVRVVTVTIMGRPGDALVDYADRDTDLLLVGTPRPGVLRRLFHSSVTRRCVVRARSPVLVVPPDALARTVLREGLARVMRRSVPNMTR
jgi:nucleotide-binding universal stress UspA family protein